MGALAKPDTPANLKKEYNQVMKDVHQEIMNIMYDLSKKAYPEGQWSLPTLEETNECKSQIAV